MDLRLGRHVDARSATATTATVTATSTSFNSPTRSRWSTAARRLWSDKLTGSTHSAMNATHTSSLESGSRSRPRPRPRSRIKNKQHRTRTRPHTRRRTTSSNPYTYTTSPFSTRLPSQHQHQGYPPPPQSLPAHCKALLKTLHRKLHILNFNLLIQLARLRVWLATKLHTRKLSQWLKRHVLRQKSEPRRPFFPRGPSCYESALQQQQASRNGSDQAEKRGTGGRIRRLSQSTVKSLKKACSLNSERDELREEDRRAMERLDELWRSREL